MRLAKKRSRSGSTVRSFVPTMYQLGFDFQAVPPTFASNKSGLGYDQPEMYEETTISTSINNNVFAQCRFWQ